MTATSLSSKTVILMDHSQALNYESGIQMEIDLGSMGAPRHRGRKEDFGTTPQNFYNMSFFPPVMKSLWTCAVENVIEYARIVYDIFSDERLIRVLMCQSNHGQTSWLNSWESNQTGSFVKGGPSNQQNVAYLTEGFANAGPPPALKKQSFTGSAVGLHAGIKAAVEGLSQPTPHQSSLINQSIVAGKGAVKPINRGRLIILTSCTAEALGQTSAEDLEDFFVTAVASQNRAASASDYLLPIIECELVVISLHAMGKESLSRVLSRPLHDISSSVRAEIYVVTPDKLNEKVVEVCAAHHDLVVSTVTNIPMKEEQNAVSSSNYDVPLFHAKMATSTEDTKMLKWSTPTAAKNGSAGLCPGGVIPLCASATRITPVDVNSRPSTCLSNFVVNGRSVWLELPSRKGKQATHVLTPHGPEMWMHVMEPRNTLEDLPAISEGVGGRITDYRINDFVNFIKSNVLAPYPTKMENLPKLKYEKDGGSFVRRRSNSVEDGKKPAELSKARLLRKSTFWPLTLSGSVLFSLSVHIDKLLTLLPTETMNEMEKNECCTAMFALMTLEARGESPPVPSTCFRKGMKRDEQWKMVFGELETFIRANLHSATHKKVLDCLLESRSTEKAAPISDPRVQESGPAGDKKSNEGGSPLPDIAKIASTPKSPMATDSPMSPPMCGSGDIIDRSTKACQPNLLTLWTQKTEKRDFRILAGGKLYPHLPDNDKETSGKSRSKSEA